MTRKQYTTSTTVVRTATVLIWSTQLWYKSTNIGHTRQWSEATCWHERILVLRSSPWWWCVYNTNTAAESADAILSQTLSIFAFPHQVDAYHLKNLCTHFKRPSTSANTSTSNYFHLHNRHNHDVSTASFLRSSSRYGSAFWIDQRLSFSVVVTCFLSQQYHLPGKIRARSSFSATKISSDFGTTRFFVS